MKNFTQIPNSIITNKDISDGAFRTYTILRSFKFYDGKVYPPQEMLAEIHDVSVRTIHNHIKELKECGLITYKRKGYSGVYFYTIIEEDNCQNENPVKEKDFISIGKNVSLQSGKNVLPNNTETKNTKINNTGIISLRKKLEKLGLKHSQKVDLTKN